jgi:hypothetical protein
MVWAMTTLAWTLARGIARLAILGAAASGCDGLRRGGGAAASPPPPAPPVEQVAATGAAPSAGASPSAAGASATTGPPSASAPSTKVVAPLSASAPIIDLPVEGFSSAVVSLPLGATGARPVLIASHGNYDRPEWQCQVWRDIVGADAFILCPRGVARRDSPSADDVRFTYESNARLEQEIGAGLRALGERFPAHVDRGAALYTGFSLGAIMGVSIASRRPALFPRLVLIEGGHDKWTVATAKAFADGGGQRVLFVCAQAGCGAAASSAAQRLTRAGVLARVVRGKDAGHRYDGPVADETKGALSWALEGDVRWRAP